MAKICMNELCKGTETDNWKKGWELKSGGFATLCSTCGSAYESSLYCESFHREESGWRECKLCNKRIHCGCIVSKDLHDYLDSGGVGCIGCSKKLENLSPMPTKVPNGDIPKGISPHTPNNVIDLQSSTISNHTDGSRVDKGKLIQPNKVTSENGALVQLSEAIGLMEEANGQVKQGGGAKGGSSTGLGARSALSLSLASSLRTPNTLEKNETSKVTHSQQGQKLGHITPKPLKSGLDANKGSGSEIRVARPPAEGRGRSQLLPRYWPRITDQELQKISGDLNSNVVPLFEKVLSASDAGRIGRLVLPKACAEAYFPPISQSEGLPIKVQDVKGSEWKFQFRFWPNNNSRMYVLEGVTPCIQNMNLEAGDTVIFSRIDPGDKLVIGFRKSSSSSDMQNNQPSSLSNGTGSGKGNYSGASDNHHPTDGVATNGAVPHQKNLIPKKKKTRHIGFKSKRLHIDDEAATELRLTWDEAQELLRPAPHAKINVIMIEDHAIEEFEEPPVFGKRTIYTSGVSGNKEQWAECDSCSKWRKLPLDFLVPSKWTCSENIWDPSRCSCSATEDINHGELEFHLRVGNDNKKRRLTENSKNEQDHEASGLDALATAAFLGENTEGLGEPSTEITTTRHPRHRPGCTCIVCIQPPSGKGKHKPTCICNVCLTVRRRFRTLMLRRKERELERKAEIDLQKEKQKSLHLGKSDACGNGSASKSALEDDKGENAISVLDLNSDPSREEGVRSATQCLPLEETSVPMMVEKKDDGASIKSSI